MICVICHDEEGTHDWREGLKLCDGCLELVAISMINFGFGRHVHPELRERLKDEGKVGVPTPPSER